MTTLQEPTLAPRLPVLVQGVASGVIGAALLGLAVAGDLPLLGGLALLQVFVTVGFLTLVDAPASAGVLLLTGAATVGADLVIWLDDGKVGGLAGVVALSLVGGLLHQLSRRERARVTESLAVTFVLVVVTCSAVCLVAAQHHRDGSWATRSALAAAGIALLAGRLGDVVLNRPALAVGATRAWPGLVLALGTGVAVAVVVSEGHLTADRAALVGLVSVATVAAVDLGLDLAAAELTPAPEDARRVSALRPVSLLLPYALLGPVVLLAVFLLDRS